MRTLIKELGTIILMFFLFYLVIWVASSYDKRHDAALQSLCDHHPEVQCGEYYDG